MKPTNRLRSTNSSMVCSRCTSVMSVNNSRMTSRCTSQMSLFQMAAMNRRLSSVTSPTQQQKSDDQDNEPPILCKICLVDYSSRDMIKLQQCSCSFCKEVTSTCIQKSRFCIYNFVFISVHGSVLVFWDNGWCLWDILPWSRVWKGRSTSVHGDGTFGWQGTDGETQDL